MAPTRNARTHERPNPLNLKKARNLKGLTRCHGPRSSVPTTWSRESTPDDFIPKIPTDPRGIPLELHDLECIKALGAGANGNVVLVRVRGKRNGHPFDKSGTIFAMKCMTKRYMRQERMKNTPDKDYEREHLVNLPWNPFICGIVNTFYDTHNLYLMLEFMCGGSLRDAMDTTGALSFSAASFYYSNIVCGLKFLQEHGIVHLDLKPDNILMGPDGYLCLADFGLSTTDVENMHLFQFSTPAYTAPELVIFQGRGAFHALDWWASGVILFEMVCDVRPFDGETHKTVYAQLRKCIYRWPSNIRAGKVLKDLVSRLLSKDKWIRIGTKGAQEVMDHAWLRKVDWNKMHSKRYIAPFVPDVNLHRLTETWFADPLPEQSTIPGLAVVQPPIHLRNDDRYSDVDSD